MDNSGQHISTNYTSYLHTTSRSCDTTGKYIKHVANFLESTEEISRRGYSSYKRKSANIMACYPLMCSAICDLLSYLKIGYGRREETVEPLKKLDSISEKNKKMLNDFIVWLTDNNDYSPRTADLHHTSMGKYFEYANEVSMDNCRRFIKMPEEEKFAPATIWSRITAIGRFPKWMKKPFELKRSKMGRKLDTNSAPTGDKYNRLLEYLKTRSNEDYYFFVEVLGTIGARLSEFLQLTWEDTIPGEMTLRGKGNKYRRSFFQKQLQQEVKAYARECGKTGLFATDGFNPMTQRGLSQGMKAQGNCYGIDKKKMHPYALRYFFARTFFKENKDMIQLADLLGHGSVDTTRIYSRKSYDEQKRDFNENVTW